MHTFWFAEINCLRTFKRLDFIKRKTKRMCSRSGQHKIYIIKTQDFNQLFLTPFHKPRQGCVLSHFRSTGCRKILYKNPFFSCVLRCNVAKPSPPSHRRTDLGCPKHRYLTSAFGKHYQPCWKQGMCLVFPPDGKMDFVVVKWRINSWS